MPKWLLFLLFVFVGSLAAQTNPLWHGEKVKNYLPDMTWPEVESLLS
jgi:creatinine amidohydrolase